MEQLTAEQLTELGYSFLSIANGVDEYRMENRRQLSDDENQSLKILHSSLTQYADDLFATSAIALVSDVGSSLQKVKEVTAGIDATYRRLRNVQKAIGIAEAAVKLGAAVFSGNPKGIKDAVSGMVTAIKAEE